MSKVASSRVADATMMARAPPKKAAKAAKAPKKAAPAKKVAKKAAPKKAAPKKAAPAKAASKASNPDGSSGVRFWAPGFGAGPLPNGGQIFFSEWTPLKEFFSLGAVGGAQGNVRAPGGKGEFF